MGHGRWQNIERHQRTTGDINNIVRLASSRRRNRCATRQATCCAACGIAACTIGGSAARGKLLMTACRLSFARAHARRNGVGIWRIGWRTTVNNAGAVGGRRRAAASAADMPPGSNSRIIMILQTLAWAEGDDGAAATYRMERAPALLKAA